MAMVTVIAASLIYTQHDLASTGATLAAAAGSVANLKFMLQGNYFVVSPDAQPFLHCWSLSVEEQFYLLFPAIFLILSLKFKQRRTLVLIVLFCLSLMCCIVLTHFRAAWAFYLLPTRAWELLAGSILASLTQKQTAIRSLTVLLPLIGLFLIALSFFVLSEKQAFPGYLAILPVAGTACVLLPFENRSNLGERILSWRPLVIVGRLSYSLYLWHWPVFSLMDYRFYTASPWFRFTLKIVVTTAAAVACYLLIEKPGRKFLNRPDKRSAAFVALISSFVILISLGLLIRSEDYVSASMRDVATGGVHFNSSGQNGSIILMGDSNASMYGTMMRGVARELGLRLTVISVDGGDPLPHSPGTPSPLWDDSIAVVRQQKPDFVVLACLWEGQLGHDEGRLRDALDQLLQAAHYVVLITEPPFLPSQASREGIRDGNRPPFIEDPNEHAVRIKANSFVESLQRGNVTVVNIESIFNDGRGGIRFTDDRGRQLYQDGDHLSAVGADLVKPFLIKAITTSDPNLWKVPPV